MMSNTPHHRPPYADSRERLLVRMARQQRTRPEQATSPGVSRGPGQVVQTDPSLLSLPGRCLHRGLPGGVQEATCRTLLKGGRHPADITA